MSSLVASWGHIRDKIGIADPNSSTSYCPSKSQILSYSSNIAIVSGYYSSNQLVKLSDIYYQEDTEPTYKIIGNISFDGDIDNISWTLFDSSNKILSYGGLTSNEYFEISYTGDSAPGYLEIIISVGDMSYINENRYTSLSFDSLICDLGIVTFESL